MSVAETPDIRPPLSELADMAEKGGKDRVKQWMLAPKPEAKKSMTDNQSMREFLRYRQMSDQQAQQFAQVTAIAAPDHIQFYESPAVTTTNTLTIRSV